MSCSCFAALLSALGPPWIELPPIVLPPLVLQLNTMVAGMAGASIMADASLTARLSAVASLGLPPLPLNFGMLTKISAAATAVAQIKAHLGIDLFAPDASLRLSATFTEFNAFPFAALALPAVGPLGPLIAILGAVKASLGLDLFAPGVNVGLALQAAVSAMISASAAFSAALPLPALSLIASYSALATAAASLGVSADFGAMAGKLQVLAALKLPTLNFNPMLLAQLLNFLAAKAAAVRTFGFDPFIVGAHVKLALALEPLKLLAAVKLHEDLAVAAKIGAVASAAAAGIHLGVDFAALASLCASLSAVATLKLPNLAPSMMLSAVIGQARSATACSPSCPVKM